jgi:PAS domain S-box-containing protein
MVLALSGLTLAAVIAERERAEAGRTQLIRERTAMETRLRLAAIVESSNDAILSTDMDGRILSWNAAAERIFGFSAAEAVGRNATMLIPASARQEESRFIQCLRSGERVDPFEKVRLTKSGKTVPVALTISPLPGAEGRTAAATIYRDITEEKRAHEALSSVNRKLIAAQEQERSRIARELHDDVAQRLALLAFEVDDLIRSTSDTVPLQQQTATLRGHVSELAADVSALSHELHSPKLELLGIMTAGREFCERAARQHEVTVVFDALGVPERLPLDISQCMYRVLQEAVHNAAKHSGVRDIQVQLRGTPGYMHLAISDHGCGFDVDASRFGRGLGLVSMAERLKLVDGELTIDSKPQRGTTIRVRVRLPGVE